MTKESRVQNDIAIQKQVDWLKGILTTLALREFQGKITLCYDRGRLTQMVEEKRHTPPR